MKAPSHTANYVRKINVRNYIILQVKLKYSKNNYILTILTISEPAPSTNL